VDRPRPFQSPRGIRACLHRATRDCPELLLCTVAELNGSGCLGPQRQCILIDIHYYLNGLAKRESYLGQPDGVNVRMHKRFIAQVQFGRAHATGDHLRSPTEKVLVLAI